MPKFEEMIKELRKYPSNDVYLKQVFIETLIEVDKILKNLEEKLKAVEELVGKEIVK